MKNLNEYVIDRRLEKGSFGTVDLAHHELLKRRVAIKVIENVIIQVRRNKEQLFNEMSILRSFRHPYVIRQIETMRTTSKYYIVMEYAEGGDLFGHLAERGKLAEGEAREVFRQMLQAVEYCHAKGVCHRDIKLENFVITATGTVKLIDFGFSKTFNYSEMMHSQLGSLKYLDPSRLKNQDYCGEAADLWSLGVILYALVVGRRPFDGEYSSAILAKALNKQYTLPTELSPGVKDLIDRMLEPSITRRLTLQEVKMHPWYVADDVGPLLDVRYMSEQSAHDRFNPYTVVPEVFDRLLTLPFDWVALGSADSVRQKIQEQKLEPVVNAYKMLYYEMYDKLLPKQPYANHVYVFKRLESLLAEPGKRERLRELQSTLFLEQRQAVAVRQWRIGLRLTLDFRTLFTKLARLFDQLKIKLEVASRGEWQFSCTFIADGKKTAHTFHVQFFDGGGARVLQLKNDTLPLLQFVRLCKRVYSALEGDQF